MALFLVWFAAAGTAYWLRRRNPEGRTLKTLTVLGGTGAVLVGAFQAAGMWQEKTDSAPINLIHIHGLAYESTGGELVVATHEGLKRYDSQKWSDAPGPSIDYMGFAPFEGGFYSSGHPVAGSDLPNPIGLIKSTDGGKTVVSLALGGQTKFNLLAVSYRKGGVYGYLQQPDEGLKEPGLYVTMDEGKTWTRCKAEGFHGDWTALAVHPEDNRTLAAGSRDGLFLSKDGGATFEQVLHDTGISALAFDLDGQLGVGAYKEQASLLQLDLAANKREEVSLPDLKQDALAYTAHDPKSPLVRVISTYDHDVFQTTDGGDSWLKLADNGKTLPKPEAAPKAAKGQ